MNKIVSIVRDIDCPTCGWPETIDFFTDAIPPQHLGSKCRECGWTSAAPAAGRGSNKKESA